MGISVSALALPTLSTALMNSYGWRTAWVMIGAAIWVLVIPLAWLVMRRRPEDYGLYPDGDVEPLGRTAQRVAQAGDDVWTRSQALRTPTLWMLIATFGLGQMGLGALLLHLIPYLTDIGFSEGEAARGFRMIGVAGLLSKPLWAFGLERVPTRLLAAGEFLLMALGIALILSVTDTLMLYLSIFVIGLGIGGVVTVQEVVWANYFGRLSLGTIRGVGRPFTVVSSAGGPVFAGAAYDLGGSYELAFPVFIGTYVMGHS